MVAAGESAPVAAIVCTSTTCPRPLPSPPTELIPALLPGDPEAAAATSARVFSQLLAAARGVFSAAAALPPALGFCPLANTFELFGADFLIDEDWKVWLLEVSASLPLSLHLSSTPLQNSRAAIAIEGAMRYMMRTCD